MIRKRDILRLLDRLGDKAGYLDKNTFLSAVINLKEVEVNPFVIKEASELRSNIIKYQRRVSIKKEKGYFTEYIERIYKLKGTHEVSVIIGEQIATDKDIVVLAKDLIQILGISKPTLSRYKKLDIINLHQCKLKYVTIDGQDFEYNNKYQWIYYYDLDEIRRRLNAYIKDRNN
ncbi:hypothetical protein [Parabacteroides sp.]